jgi:membrane protein DedA with SNARE-associated domain
LVVAERSKADDRHMIATTVITATTNTPADAGAAARVVRWVRGRLAPTAEDLEERADWKVKTRWILGAWATLSVVSMVGTALTPLLWGDFFLVLVALTPRLGYLPFAAAASANPVVFFSVVVPRMLLGDPIHITLGRRYGARFVPKPAQRLMNRFGLLGVALRPTSKVLAAAGACRMRTSRVLIADILGTLVTVTGVYFGTTLFGEDLFKVVVDHIKALVF